MNVPTNPTYKLPRPNPGPETWPNPGVSPGWWVAGVFGIIGLILAAIWLVSKSRHAATRRSDVPGEIVEMSPLLALAESTRDALAKRFGASWRAKTTEEIMQALLEENLIEIGHLDTIGTLLRKADRTKFSGDDPHGDPGEEFRTAVAEALAAIESNGLRSMSNG